MAWPAMQLDLIPMDFFLWGHTKAPISVSPVYSEQDLNACIVEAAATRLRCFRLCVNVSGRLFEHLL
jgi:hypothetical protein